MKNRMVKKNVIVFAMILLAWTGCKKEKKEEVEEQLIDEVISIKVRDSIVIGRNLPADSIKITTANLDINVVNDSNELVEKKQQFDMNADGKPDFEINVSCKLHTPNFVYEESYIQFKALNGDSYFLADSIYERVTLNDDGIINKTTYNDPFPKLLSKNTQISLTKDRWRNTLFPIIPNPIYFPSYLILSTCPTRNDPKHFTINAGVWRDAKDQYIAIRYKNELGWIKMSIPGRSHVIVSEVALSH